MEQTTNYQREVKITKSRRENLLNLFTYMCMHIFKKYSMSHCSVLFLEFIKLEFRNIKKKEIPKQQTSIVINLCVT